MGARIVGRRLVGAASAAAAALLAPAAVAAHVGPDGEPVPDGLYATLFIETELLIVMAAATGLMLWTFGPWRRRVAPHAPWPRLQVGLWVLAMIVFYAVVGTSVDEIGERYLFWMHMLQHTVMMYVAAPLLVAAMPGWLADELGRRPVAGPFLRFWTHPVTACLVYSAVFGLWHIPALYDWALRDQAVHNLEHATMLGASVLMWWPISGPKTGIPRAGHVQALFYLLGLTILNMPLFAFLTFAKRPLYPTYANAPRIMEMSAYTDQVFGGALMKLTGMLVMFVLIALVFLRWTSEAEKADRRPSIRPQEESS